MSQLSLNAVTVEFGATLIFRDVTFAVARGDRWGIVGRNGTGKTTLLNVIAGRLEPTRGSVARAGGLRFTLLDQHRAVAEDASAWDVAASPFAELVALEHSLQEQATRLGVAGSAATESMLNRYDRDLERFARAGGYEMDARVDAVLQGLAFDPAAARTQPFARLSGGEQGRIALARELVAPADVLLLDEPTNHLDLATTSWLEDYLRTLTATVLVISHDRVFLQNVVDHVLHVENDTAYAYRGDYRSFVEQRAARLLAQERAFSAQQRTIAAEEDYIRRNIAGQNSRQAKGRRKRLERLPRLSTPVADAGTMALRLQPHARGGDQVLVAQDVSMAVGERMLVRDFSARVVRGERIGLIGANGTGKSTLLRAIAGELPVTAGELRVGESTRPAFYRQDLAQVPLGRSLFDIIHDVRPLWDRGQVQAHLGRFAFSGDSVRRSADSLSGGERARVALALLMLSQANFILFDEPTNHLDVESIEALEDAVDDFDGTVLLVSHDRALLRALVTRVWHLESGTITDFNGSFVEWEDAERERAEQAARSTDRAANERQTRARANARANERKAATTKAELRALRSAVAAAEEQVRDLETRAASLRARLADPELYADPAAGARAAALITTELAAADAALQEALEEWTGLVDKLEESGV